jgi:phosphomethylpyrimidine synthase
MKISDEVREYAKKNGLDSQEAIEIGMKNKSEEFKEKGGEIYTS